MSVLNKLVTLQSFPSDVNLIIDSFSTPKPIKNVYIGRLYTPYTPYIEQRSSIDSIFETTTLVAFWFGMTTFAIHLSKLYFESKSNSAQ